MFFYKRLKQCEEQDNHIKELQEKILRECEFYSEDKQLKSKGLILISNKLSK